MLAHPPFHQQPTTQAQAPSQQQQTVSQHPPTVSPELAAATPSQQTPQLQQPQSAGTFQTLRLRDDPPQVTHPAPRTSRKRKSPTSSNQEAQQQQQQQQQQPPQMHPAPPQGMPVHPMPPPHGMVHPAHMGPPMSHAYQYVPSDYTAAGIPPPQPVPQQPPPGPPLQQSDASQQASSSSAAGRTLSQSKRAEQNRKAQRAFRERRDQHVKALESRSQLLDAALASADEANRRWEECRALVDQLRIENAALRAALSQAQESLRNGTNVSDTSPTNGPPQSSVGADGVPNGGVKEAVAMESSS